MYFESRRTAENPGLREFRERLPVCDYEAVPERSVVIPVYNGSASIFNVVHELMQELAERPTEIILVNDGSQDDSEQCCLELVDHYPGRVTLIQFSRNFGEYAAVLAGLRQCRGEAIVIVDDDGQQPADEARRLLEAVERNRFDVAYGRYVVRRQSWWRRCAGYVHNIGACLFLGKPRGLYLSSFKALSRFIVQQVCDGTGANPYFDGLILQITKNVTQIDVLHRRRRTGRSGYTPFRLMRVWFDMCIGFSAMPYRMATIVGAAMGVLGATVVFIALLFARYWQLTWITALTGWITVLFGIVLFYLGLTGEHIMRGIGRSRASQPYVIRYIHRAGVTHDG
jgi:undecaprenyl-phosphate 4-deoxy-4-formamido-L-arabinose transferase